MTLRFPRGELAAAFEKFERTVARAADPELGAWVTHYTTDVEYVEHAAGTMPAKTTCATGSGGPWRTFR